MKKFFLRRLLPICLVLCLMFGLCISSAFAEVSVGSSMVAAVSGGQIYYGNTSVSSINRSSTRMTFEFAGAGRYGLTGSDVFTIPQGTSGYLRLTVSASASDELTSSMWYGYFYPDDSDTWSVGGTSSVGDYFMDYIPGSIQPSTRQWTAEYSCYLDGSYTLAAKSLGLVFNPGSWQYFDLTLSLDKLVFVADDGTETDLSQIKNTVDDIRDSLPDYVDDVLEGIDEQTQQMQTQIDGIQDKLDSIESNGSSTSADVDSIRQEVEQMQDDVELMQSQLGYIQGSLINSEGYLGDITLSADNAERHLGVIRDQIELIIEALAEHSVEVPSDDAYSGIDDYENLEGDFTGSPNVQDGFDNAHGWGSSFHDVVTIELRNHFLAVAAMFNGLISSLFGMQTLLNISMFLGLFAFVTGISLEVGTALHARSSRAYKRNKVASKTKGSGDGS